MTLLPNSTTQVREYEASWSSLLEFFLNGRTQTFKAGSLVPFSHIWHKLTSDPEILEVVTGQHIEFDTVPMQEKHLMQTKLSNKQTESVDLETAQLKKLLFNSANMRPGNSYQPYLRDPKKMVPII